ncbi:MAG: hypothetical protein EOP24_38975 [Hyphomicrobiales bacterium]|nr:MAG: hypothetical protein EOP24_38975 [Hyphomicrobiales bacterium]
MSIRDGHEVPLGHHGVLQQTKVDGALDQPVEQIRALGHAAFDLGYSGFASESQACRFTARNKNLAQSSRWTMLHMVGLTVSLSNMLLPLSSHLVRRNESAELTHLALERIKQSTPGTVRIKSEFPSALGIVPNRVTLRPLDRMQKFFTRSERALVLYFKAQPPKELIHG